VRYFHDQDFLDRLKTSHRRKDGLKAEGPMALANPTLQKEEI